MIRVRRALLAAGILVTSALLTTGCPRPPDPPFEGSTWYFFSGVAPLVPGEPFGRPTPSITTRFAPAVAGAGEVTGSAGCNTFTGTYQRNGNQLTIGSITSTEIGCAPDLMARETAYLARLTQVASMKMNYGNLELRAADGSTILTYTGLPPAPPTSSTTTTTRPFTLAGIYGVLQYLRDTTLTPATSGSDQVIVEMQPDGRLLGQACNRFEGTWTSRGDTIRFEAAFTTERACTTPATRDVEEWFLPALTSATHWQRDRGGPLTLTRADGTTVVKALLVL